MGSGKQVFIQSLLDQCVNACPSVQHGMCAMPTYAPTSAPSFKATATPTTATPTASPTTATPTLATESPTTASPTLIPTTAVPSVSPTSATPTRSPTVALPGRGASDTSSAGANSGGGSGAAAGGSVGGLLFCAGLFYFFFYRKKREDEPDKELDGDGMEMGEYKGEETEEYSMDDDDGHIEASANPLHSQEAIAKAGSTPPVNAARAAMIKDFHQREKEEIENPPDYAANANPMLAQKSISPLGGRGTGRGSGRGGRGSIGRGGRGGRGLDPQQQL